MSNVTMSVKQILELGLWEKVCDYKGWDTWIVNEGRIQEDELVTFDTEFKKESTVHEIKWKDTLNCEKLFPKPLYECIMIAKDLNFKYVNFNGLIYDIEDNGRFIMSEDELII